MFPITDEPTHLRVICNTTQRQTNSPPSNPKEAGSSQVRKNLKPDDLVLIVDETSPRSSWLMGRVTETIPDSRGHVRRVKVRTKSNVLERPITKLCLLLEA